MIANAVSNHWVAQARATPRLSRLPGFADPPLLRLKTLAVTCVVITSVTGIAFQFRVKENAKLGPMGAGVDVTNPPESKYHDVARLDLFHLV